MEFIITTIEAEDNGAQHKTSWVVHRLIAQPVNDQRGLSQSKEVWLRASKAIEEKFDLAPDFEGDDDTSFLDTLK